MTSSSYCLKCTENKLIKVLRTTYRLLFFSPSPSPLAPLCFPPSSLCPVHLNYFSLKLAASLRSAAVFAASSWALPPLCPPRSQSLLSSRIPSILRPPPSIGVKWIGQSRAVRHHVLAGGKGQGQMVGVSSRVRSTSHHWVVDPLNRLSLQLASTGLTEAPCWGRTCHETQNPSCAHNTHTNIHVQWCRAHLHTNRQLKTHLRRYFRYALISPKCESSSFQTNFVSHHYLRYDFRKE